jgi:hypothetical protein
MLIVFYIAAVLVACKVLGVPDFSMVKYFIMDGSLPDPTVGGMVTLIICSMLLFAAATAILALIIAGLGRLWDLTAYRNKEEGISGSGVVEEVMLDDELRAAITQVFDDGSQNWDHNGGWPPDNDEIKEQYDRVYALTDHAKDDPE